MYRIESQTHFNTFKGQNIQMQFLWNIYVYKYSTHTILIQDENYVLSLVDCTDFYGITSQISLYPATAINKKKTDLAIWSEHCCCSILKPFECTLHRIISTYTYDAQITKKI